MEIKSNSKTVTVRRIKEATTPLALYTRKWGPVERLIRDQLKVLLRTNIAGTLHKAFPADGIERKDGLIMLGTFPITEGHAKDCILRTYLKGDDLVFQIYDPREGFSDFLETAKKEYDAMRITESLKHIPADWDDWFLERMSVINDLHQRTAEGITYTSAAEEGWRVGINPDTTPGKNQPCIKPF